MPARGCPSRCHLLWGCCASPSNPAPLANYLLATSVINSFCSSLGNLAGPARTLLTGPLPAGCPTGHCHHGMGHRHHGRGTFTGVRTPSEGTRRHGPRVSAPLLLCKHLPVPSPPRGAGGEGTRGACVEAGGELGLSCRPAESGCPAGAGEMSQERFRHERGGHGSAGPGALLQ